MKKLIILIMVQINELNGYEEYLSETYSPYFSSKIITLFLLRRCESSCVFQSENEKLRIIETPSGIDRNDIHHLNNSFNRIAFPIGRQCAHERREGRNLLRELKLLNPIKGEICEINKNLCGTCLDCQTYGYAMNGSSSKSKLSYGECISLLPYEQISKRETSIGLNDGCTMYDPKTKTFSQSLFSTEFVKTGAVFLDILTMQNVTENQLIYIIGNILRTTRYGANINKMGEMKNELIKMTFSNVKIGSVLKWTRHTYDQVCEDLNIPNGKIPSNAILYQSIKNAAVKAYDLVIKDICGTIRSYSDNELKGFLSSIQIYYQNNDWLKKCFSMN